MTLCAEISMEVKVPNTDLLILGHATQGKLGLNKLAAAGGLDEGSNYYWANFLSDSARITLSRGRTDTDPTALVQAGVATAEVFGNTWDPSQTDILVPGRDVRIMQDTDTLWTGKVWDTTTGYDQYRQAYTTVTCYDSTRDLFNTMLDADLENIESVSDRLDAVMGGGYAVTGTTAATLAPKQATTVGEILSLIQASELGFTYVDRDGFVQVRARSHTKPAVSIKFSDDHSTDPDHQCYTDIGLAYDTEDIWNAVDMSNYAGINGYGQDVVDQYKAPGESVSVATYGEHLLSATTNLDIDTNDDQITDWRQEIIDRYASPTRRVKTITYHPWDNGVLTHAGVDVGDTVRITFHDEFGMELVDELYTVYGVNHQIEPTSWQTTLTVGDRQEIMIS